VRQLTGGYTKALVLRGIDLSVAAGEIVGVLGANGAGKTSLLRALSGVLPNCSGEVVLGGLDLGKRGSWARAKAGLAHIPEGRHVLGAMSVRENLEVAALVARRRIALNEVFELFPRLSERQTQAAGSLSGGEQQMLAIGRGVMMDPKVMMIDELSAGLAPVVIDQLVDGLVRLRSRGVGILLVEQSPHLVAGTVERVYLLEQGRVVREGTLDALGGAEGLAALYLGVKGVAGTQRDKEPHQKTATS
jgi:branched-chain amino acid transport system ATP-binding protein